jgi:hypothetical protein
LNEKDQCNDGNDIHAISLEAPRIPGNFICTGKASKDEGLENIEVDGL